MKKIECWLNKIKALMKIGKASGNDGYAIETCSRGLKVVHSGTLCQFRKCNRVILFFLSFFLCCLCITCTTLMVATMNNNEEWLRASCSPIVVTGCMHGTRLNAPYLSVHYTLCVHV